jgi:hypothetical protein
LLLLFLFCLLEEMGNGDPFLHGLIWDRQDADENEVTILMIINHLGSLNDPPWRKHRQGRGNEKFGHLN